MKALQRWTCAFILSLATLFPATTPGQTTAVTFPDPNLEAAVRSALNKPAGVLTSSDMLSLYSVWEKTLIFLTDGPE
jgi:hypothetical protein